MVARRGIPGGAVAASALIRALSLALVLALPAGTACAAGAGDEKKWTEEIGILDALVDVLADEGR